MSMSTTTAQTRKWPRRLVRGCASVLLGLAIAVVYVAVGRFGRRLDALSEESRVFFPQSGIGVAALLLFGLRYWPAVAVGSWLNLVLTRTPLSASLISQCLTGGHFPGCLFTDDTVTYSLAPYVVLGNTLSPAFAAFMLRRAVRFDPRFSRLNDCYRFLLYAVLLAPLISAALATWRFVTIEPLARRTWHELFYLRWLGQAISNVVIAPPILTWSHLPRRRWTPGQLVELFLLLVCLSAMGMLAFTRSSVIGLLNYPVSYLPFPLILWAALRFGVRGGASSTLIVAGIAIYGSSQQAGPFVLGGASPTVNVLLLQIYLVVLAGTGLLLGALSNERSAAMGALAASREEMRRLAASLQAAREEERAYLARELHDELAQLFAGMKIAVKRLAKVGGDDPALRLRCEEVAGLTDEAVAAMRRLATNLRPGILDDLGLVEAIRWQCEDFQRRYGIEARFDAGAEMPEAAPEAALALFRVLQEALTNVAKHARAASVLVRLQVRDGHLELEVRDDGCGFDADHAAEGPGLGIVGMRERIRMIGGELTIGAAESTTGRGTAVLARLPIDNLRRGTQTT
jgi:signal transduction histidine kinase